MLPEYEVLRSRHHSLTSARSIYSSLNIKPSWLQQYSVQNQDQQITTHYTMPSQSSIIWPDHFLPGTTDNFVSNERIAKDITSANIWSLLTNITKWESYYKNCDQVEQPSSGHFLHKGDVFKFSTFGFPQLTCTVEESEAPEANGKAGRIAWSSKTDEGLEIYHAWLVEDLEGQRVRILTQESQIGPVFKDLEKQKPNPMLLGHQDWLDGLITAARGGMIGKTNLEAIEFPVKK